MDITRESIFQALRAVADPCSIAMLAPQSIVDLGLVESISITGRAVRISLVLTDASCVHFSGMRGYISDLLLGLDGVDSVEVVASTTQLWTPDRQNPASAPAEVGSRKSLPLASR